MLRPATKTLALSTALLSGCMIALSGCATAIDTPTQDLRIEILGTGQALCDLRQEGRRYRVYAPATLRVYKDDSPMKVRCAAPGNRVQTVVLDPKVDDWTYGDIATGVLPGLAWDYASGAMYQYPDKVVIDYTGMPAQPYPLPDYQLVFEENPQLIGMEQFRPGSPALIGDMGTRPPELEPRQPGDFESSSDIMVPAPRTGGGSSAASPSTPAPAPAPALGSGQAAAKPLGASGVSTPAAPASSTNNGISSGGGSGNTTLNISNGSSNNGSSGSTSGSGSQAGKFALPPIPTASH